MKISVIIPAFNEEKNIFACIQAVKVEAKNYNFPVEIIVVDNLSEDHTYDRAEEALPDFLVRRGPRGVVHARQNGYWTADGEFLAFIDADSRMPKGWIGRALYAFQDPKVVAVSGPLHFYDSPELNDKSEKFYKLQMFMHKYMPTLQGGNFMLRKSALDQVKGFDLKFQFYGEDTSTAIRMSKVGKVLLDDQLVIETSARRFKQQGVVNTTFTYIMNYLAVSALGTPVSPTHKNFR